MQKVLGQKINFSRPEILQQALTHRSARNANNERLEFLGDSILGYVITKWLYLNFPDLSEGKLSRMRSSLVKGETLAEVARHYEIGDVLILGVGELKSGGFNRSSVLADAVEAIIGAVFIEKGIDVTENFILTALQQWLEKVNPKSSEKDAKTRLQEILQSKGFRIPLYELISKQGKDHLQTFTMKCSIEELNVSTIAEKRSRKKAEQLAAQMILEKIEEQL
jgi:ribonuclease-3